LDITLEGLYKLAERKGYTVDQFPIKGKGLCVQEDGRCYIAMRPDLTETEEKETLAHELGHCEYGGFYSRCTAFDTVQRHEYRANKWAYFRLIPPEEVKRCFARGICQTWEIAEEIGVSCTFAAKALEYYHSEMII